MGLFSEVTVKVLGRQLPAARVMVSPQFAAKIDVWISSLASDIPARREEINP